MENHLTKQSNMSPVERVKYLQERGVIIETSEDRKKKKTRDIISESDEIDGKAYEDLTFVHVPHDQSLILKELSAKVPKDRLNHGDLLITELKSWFQAISKTVDLSLLKGQETKHLGSTNLPQVSESSLMKVAEEGQVEIFCLVHPVQSNHHTSINIYLDEVGLLKRLPLNKRASEFALRAGFNPPPKFYGDVFLGRVKSKPALKNIDFRLNDTHQNATWLKNATMENLEHQTSMNKITGSRTMPPSDGEDGVAKLEEGYSWTQTNEEIELVVPLKNGEESKAFSKKDVKGGGLKVFFFPKKIAMNFMGDEILHLALFDRVDTDGCTWTLESNCDGISVVITCEKSDLISWPRITK